MKTKHFFFTIVLLAMCVVTASCNKDPEASIDSPTKVMKNVTITKTDKAGKTINAMRVDYSYDAQKRITAIQFFNIDGKGKATPYYKFDYTYNADNLVSKARYVQDAMFLDAVFTYNADKEITKIVYSGLISKTVDVTYSSKGYLFLDGTVQLSYDTHQVFNIQTSSSTYTFIYEGSMQNGSANLGAQVGIPTFFVFSGYGAVLFNYYIVLPNIFNAGVLKEIQKDGVYLFQITNEKDKLGFITRSTFKLGNDTNTAVYTYQK